MKSFRENLRDELDYQGMTVKELSEKTGIIKGSLDNYLGTRESIPPADVAVKIARALNVSVEYLVSGEDLFFHENLSTFRRFKNTISELNALPIETQHSICNLIHTISKGEKNKVLGKL